MRRSAADKLNIEYRDKIFLCINRGSRRIIAYHPYCGSYRYPDFQKAADRDSEGGDVRRVILGLFIKTVIIKRMSKKS